MSRRIVTSKLEGLSSKPSVDTYFDKVLKYIPADVNGAWIAATGLIKSVSDVPQTTILWIAFAFGVVVTAIWTLQQTVEPGKRPAITQTLLSTGAFAVWVFALGDPFTSLNFYQPLYGSLMLIAYTLVVALVNPPES
ncbi:MAG: hypothetical protein HC833_00975 [Leptolyngbyaceae cyanobacterium RM1_406_9]|nr:hypothetical protein [Leptolyngbyaceae cyanobacterium RM1_406_9]